MKVRKRKKIKGIRCSHCKIHHFMVTDDPFPMYNDEFICSLKGISIYNPYFYVEELPCEKCKKYTVSKKAIKESYLYNRERRRTNGVGRFNQR